MAINVAAEIRELLAKDRSMTGRQVREAIETKYGVSLNENSTNVAFSIARRTLGIRRRSQPVLANATYIRSPATSRPVSLESIQAAASLVAHVGDVQSAVELVTIVGVL